MADQSKNHWDTVYKTRQPNQVSWTQEIPKTSLDFIHSFNLPKSARIIDVGGGDGKLADYLIAEGYENITVLDISETALRRTRERLKNKGKKVRWIVSDINRFEPEITYDIWHDRATFHFLTSQKQINRYIATASKATKGYMAIGTFSETGPNMCSGLKVKQYSEEDLQTELAKGFKKIRCIKEDHVTPFNTTQNFLFCSFKSIH